MILWRLFYTFLKIGIFTFGGGYAMIALIQNEVVEKNGWMTAQEFTDIVATSQITPGPVGINTATYAGYTAVANSGGSPALAVAGAFLASFAVILLPFVLTLVVSRLLIRHKEHPIVASTLSVLRLAVVGLIAAAALLLLTPDNFGTPGTDLLQFITSVVLFAAVFIASYKFKANPILLILVCGAIGAILYL